MLAAFYYNRGAQWGRPTSITYKHDAMMFGSGIVEIERGKFADAKPFYWQSDTAIARNSWCYTETLDYKSVKEIIWDLIEVVSKNGNLLLNIGPKADGSIPKRDREILLEIGKWLQVNGEGIYESKVWRKAGEGPTALSDGQFQETTVTCYTCEDIRFTVRGTALYAFVMEPSPEELVIRSLAVSQDQNTPEFHGIIQKIELLGVGPVTDWQQTTVGLIVNLPPVVSQLPITLKIIME